MKNLKLPAESSWKIRSFDANYIVLARLVLEISAFLATKQKRHNSKSKQAITNLKWPAESSWKVLSFDVNYIVLACLVLEISAFLATKQKHHNSKNKQAMTNLKQPFSSPSFEWLNWDPSEDLPSSFSESVIQKEGNTWKSSARRWSHRAPVS